MIGARGVTVLVLLALCAAGLSGQMCDPDGEGLVVGAAGAHSRQAGEGGHGWGAGLRAHWHTRGPFAAGASYRRDDLRRGPMQTIGVDAGVRLERFPGSPCVTVALMATRISGLNDGDRYRNMSIPVGLVFFASGAVAPFGGFEAIFSTTDARLLGHGLRTQWVGAGLLAGLRLRAYRIRSDFALRASTLGASLGPQPLARVRAEVGVGLEVR